jgi:hypothetical protein
MIHHRQNHITETVDALAVTASHLEKSSTEHELLTTLAQLASISTLVGELASDYQMKFARWATVTPHLGQARELAAALARSLNHARGVVEFNSALQPAGQLGSPEPPPGRAMPAQAGRPGPDVRAGSAFAR